jgi:hypothetical protein
MDQLKLKYKKIYKTVLIKHYKYVYKYTEICDVASWKQVLCLMFLGQNVTE